MNRKPRVFLSHASEDKMRVREIYGQLKERGFQPWLDEVDLLPGQEFDREIPLAIKKSDGVLFRSPTQLGSLVFGWEEVVTQPPINPK